MTFQASVSRYETMTYARCGRSGLMLPRISLGLWHNFGDVDCYAKARSVALRAFDLGITHFDLANNYGPPPGSAERNFGRMLREDLGAYRDELIISSKAGYRMWDGPYGEWGSRKSLLSSLDQSLKRLGLDYVDIFYSHRPDPTTPLEETMSALDQAVRSGRALYAGISNYKPEQAKQAIAILRELKTPCLIHQPSYSILNRWIEEEGLTTVLENEGLGCIAFSPLAQGQLTERYLDSIPADSRVGRGGFLTLDRVQANLGKVRALHSIAQERGQPLAEMALAWTLRNPVVTSALIGASSVGQLEQNVKALNNLQFSPEELAAIDAISKAP